MYSTYAPKPQSTFITNEAPSMHSFTLGAKDLELAGTHRPRKPVVFLLLSCITLLAFGYTAIQNALVTLIAHLILAHLVPPALHPTSGPFAAACLKATFALSLIGTPIAHIPDLFQVAYVCLQADFDPAAIRARRAAPGSTRPFLGRLYAQRAMRQAQIALSGLLGSLAYRAIWCSLEGCDALGPLHATVAAVVGMLLLWSYHFVRELYAEDVSEELERLCQEQLLEAEGGGPDKQSVGAKDQAFHADSAVHH